MINWIDSSKRGLSRSRNLALHSASCDYCLIADDDEVFVDGVDKIIEIAFRDNPESDVLIFKLNNWETKYPSHTKMLATFKPCERQAIRLPLNVQRL